MGLVRGYRYISAGACCLLLFLSFSSNLDITQTVTSFPTFLDHPSHIQYPDPVLAAFLWLNVILLSLSGWLGVHLSRRPTYVRTGVLSLAMALNPKELSSLLQWVSLWRSYMGYRFAFILSNLTRFGCDIQSFVRRKPQHIDARDLRECFQQSLSTNRPLSGWLCSGKRTVTCNDAFFFLNLKNHWLTHIIVISLQIWHLFVCLCVSGLCLCCRRCY